MEIIVDWLLTFTVALGMIMGRGVWSVVTVVIRSVFKNRRTIDPGEQLQKAQSYVEKAKCLLSKIKGDDEDGQ